MGLGQSAFQAWIASLPIAMVNAGRTDADIGVAVGSASVFNVLASLAAGGLIDRYGGFRVLIAGAALNALAALAFVGGLAQPSSPLPVLIAIRCLQGAGLAAVIPSALSLVPSLVGKPQVATALASVGVAANLSLAIMPPLSLVILDRAGLGAVGVVAVATSLLCITGTLRLPSGVRSLPATGGTRRFRPTWRRAWAGPLLICLLYIVHWGVVTAYLPQRAEAAGADVGLFFTGDAITLVLMRLPGGYLVSRYGSLWPMIAGLSVTLGALLLLLLPLSTELLFISGAGTGFSAALILPSILIDLSHRSADVDRGSAFGLYGVAFGGGITIGSIGTAPLVGALGFHVLLIGGMAALVAGIGVALWDARALDASGQSGTVAAAASYDEVTEVLPT